MRVALLFCGRINGYKECYQSFIKHIVNVLGVEYDSFLAHNSENKINNINLFSKLYSVKNFTDEIPEIDHFQNFPRNMPWTMGLNGFKMFYFWKKAYELMEDYSKLNNVHYDFVIYMRADQLFETDIKLPPLEDNCVYIPHGYDYCGTNDQMAIGKTDVMKKFMNLYSNIDKIYSESQVLFHPESYVKLHSEMSEIKIERFNIDYYLHSSRHE
jgi:hypothetical protein